MEVRLIERTFVDRSAQTWVHVRGQVAAGNRQQGRNRDTDWFSIIDADWPRLRRGFGRWLDPGNFDSSGRQRRRLQDCLEPED